MKFKKLNKKGSEAFDILIMLYRIIVLIIVTFAILMLITANINASVDTFDAEANLFAINTVYALSNIEEYSGKAEPGTIDLQKFLSGELAKTLNKSIDYGFDNQKIAAKLTLKNITKNNLGEIIYNPDYYYEWDVKSRALWNIGPGGVKEKTNVIYILIKNNDKQEGGYLEIRTIIPNT